MRGDKKLDAGFQRDLQLIDLAASLFCRGFQVH
jgi:hypothetical protein